MLIIPKKAQPNDNIHSATYKTLQEVNLIYKIPVELEFDDIKLLINPGTSNNLDLVQEFFDKKFPQHKK